MPWFDCPISNDGDAHLYKYQKPMSATLDIFWCTKCEQHSVFNNYAQLEESK